MFKIFVKKISKLQYVQCCQLTKAGHCVLAWISGRICLLCSNSEESFAAYCVDREKILEIEETSQKLEIVSTEVKFREGGGSRLVASRKLKRVTIVALRNWLLACCFMYRVVSKQFHVSCRVHLLLMPLGCLIYVVLFLQLEYDRERFFHIGKANYFLHYFIKTDPCKCDWNSLWSVMYVVYQK